MHVSHYSNRQSGQISADSATRRTVLKVWKWISFVDDDLLMFPPCRDTAVQLSAKWVCATFISDVPAPACFCESQDVCDHGLCFLLYSPFVCLFTRPSSFPVDWFLLSFCTTFHYLHSFSPSSVFHFALFASFPLLLSIINRAISVYQIIWIIEEIKVGGKQRLKGVKVVFCTSFKGIGQHFGQKSWDEKMDLSRDAFSLA